MTIQERLQKAEADFNAAELQVKRLEEEVQRATLYREQVRGRYLECQSILQEQNQEQIIADRERIKQEQEQAQQES